VNTFSSVESAKNSLNIKKKVIQDIIKSGSGDFKDDTQHYLFFFAQNRESIIPDLQVTLKSSRKKVKKMMGLIENSDNAEDQMRYRVLNGRQLAIKVTMNSIYGFTSAFMLNMSSLSACVTGRGRQMIEMTKEFMENEFETIAKSNYWTREDTQIYYNNIMKEVVTDSPEPGWIKKFPTAIENEPWTRTDLNINVVGGVSDTFYQHFIGY
jgi:DNA polymerase elongation subunit (family B)